MQALSDHALGNRRVLVNTAAELLALAAERDLSQLDEKLYLELRSRFRVQFDIKQSIGKRYARMDEAGTPVCFTIDGDTVVDQTVTARDRDSGAQERIALDRVAEYLARKVGGLEGPA